MKSQTERRDVGYPGSHHRKIKFKDIKLSDILINVSMTCLIKEKMNLFLVTVILKKYRLRVRELDVFEK